MRRSCRMLCLRIEQASHGLAYRWILAALLALAAVALPAGAVHASFGGGSTRPSAKHVTIRLTATDAGGRQLVNGVWVNTDVTIAISAIFDLECQGDSQVLNYTVMVSGSTFASGQITGSNTSPLAVSPNIVVAADSVKNVSVQVSASTNSTDGLCVDSLPNVPSASLSFGINPNGPSVTASPSAPPLYEQNPTPGTYPDQLGVTIRLTPTSTTQTLEVPSVDWGDGSSSQGTFTHVYSHEGSYTVIVTDSDSASNLGSDWFTVQAIELPLDLSGASLTFTAPDNSVLGGTMVEGQQFTATVAGVADPDGGTSFTYYIMCPGGQSFPRTPIDNGFASSSQSCFADTETGVSSFNVEAVIFDSEGHDVEMTRTVQVMEVPPTGTFTATSPVLPNSPSTLSFSNVFDPGPFDTRNGFQYFFNCAGDSSSLPTGFDFSASNTALPPYASSTTCTYTAPGLYTVVGRIMDSHNDYPKPDYTASVKVLGHATITPPSPSIVYGTAVGNLAGSASVIADNAFPNVSPSVTGLQCSPAAGTVLGVGTYGTHCFGASDTTGDYTIGYGPDGRLSVTPHPLTITADDKTMTFGDSVPAFTASPSGLVNGDSLGGAVSGLSCQSLDGNGHPVSSSTPPGNYSITCSYTSSPNYSISLVPGTLTIHPAVITVTADNKSMGYGAGAFPQFTATYSGKNTSGVTGTLSCVAKDGQSNPIQPSAPAGNYSIDCSGSQLTAPTGYTLSYVPGTLTIDAAPLGIVANNKTMTYGGAVPAFDAAINGLVNGDSASVVTGLTCGAVDAHGNPVSQFTPAGNYTIMCSGASAANYAIVYTSGTLTIKPAPLLITANNQTAIYRGTLPALTWTGSGWVNGEGPGALTTQPTCTTVTTTNPVGTYAINCSGAVDPNYAITYAPGKLFITYAICPLYSQTAPNNRGSTIPIKVQICDAAKKNLSTSSITLKALTVTGPVSNVPKPSGTSNPGNIFRYDSQILGYIYNLDSSPYPKGTYQLTFSVAGDPLNHTVGFVIG